MSKCPVCKATGISVKKNGDLWKHETPEGDKCDNISTVPEIKTNKSVKNETSDKDLVEVSDKSGSDEIKSEPVREKREFTFTITLTKPCNYLQSAEWHASNKRLAEHRATASGESVTGEAQFEGTTDRGRKIVVTYKVPVR